MEMDNETDVLFSCQGVISTFKSYFLGNAFCKALAATVTPLTDLGKVN